MNNKILYSVIACLLLVIAFLLLWNNEAKAPTINEGTAPASTTSTPPTNSTNTPQHTTAAASPSKVRVGSSWATLVYYTKDGFFPKTVTIQKGELVRFVNHSNLSMRIVSNTYQNAPLYPSLDELKSVGYGKTFDFLFDKAGTWGYHNLNGNALVSGDVIVR